MDQMLEWFGVQRYRENLERVRRFWQGEGRFVISVYPTSQAYRQIFDDREIVERACSHLQAQASLPGLNLPSFYPDYGTISTAKYWGGQVHFDSTGGNIFVDPVVQTVQEAMTLSPMPVDDPRMDGERGLKAYREVVRCLDTDALWFRSPDMQGTLNTAGLIVNQEELLMAMYTEPSLVHAFLDKVCNFLIRYARYLREQTGNKVCGNIWPYTFFPTEFGLSLTEDLMPLLSASLYKEFGIPYLRKLDAVFGGLHIHCCGDWGWHAQNLAESGLTIKAMEFHYPATRLEELTCLADRTVFIPYILLHKQTEFSSAIEYYTHLIEHYGTRYRFWFACADDNPETLAFTEKYGAYAG